MKRSPFFRLFPLALLVGCHRASGEEAAVHDALAAKYGEAVAQSAVGRLRSEAVRKKSDVGKSVVWTRAANAARYSPESLLSPEEMTHAQQDAFTRREVEVALKKAKPYAGDLDSLFTLSLVRAKAMLTLEPLDRVQHAWDRHYVGLLKNGSIVAVGYERGTDPAWQDRPTFIDLLPVAVDQHPKTWDEALKLYGLDPSRLESVDYTIYAGRRYGMPSHRYGGVPYEIRFMGGRIHFLSDTYGGN